MADATLSSDMDSFLTEAALSITQRDSLGILDGYIFLGEATASASSQINVDNVCDSIYSAYRVLLRYLRPATDAVALELVLRTTAPANLSGTYKSGFWRITSTSAASSVLENATGTIGWNVGNNCGNAAGEDTHGWVDVFLGPNAGSSDKRAIIGTNGINAAGAVVGNVGGCYLSATTIVGGFGVAFSTGNITSGKMEVYGLLGS